MTIGYVTANYYSKTEIPEPYRVEMIRYIVNTAHPVDGGWGLHSVDKSTCFGTTMNYVCLRLLGMEKDHPVLVKARKHYIVWVVPLRIHIGVRLGYLF